MDPSKYRPINLLTIGGKILQKLLTNRINHYVYKHNLLTDRQFGFTAQKSTTNAAMEAKTFIELILERRGLVRKCPSMQVMNVKYKQNIITKIATANSNRNGINNNQLKSISCTQINLQHTRVATDYLTNPIQQALYSYKNITLSKTNQQE
jgi:hypothetical protein